MVEAPPNTGEAMELNPTEIEKLPKDVAFALAALTDSMMMMDDLCAKQRENTDAYDGAYETVARLAYKASNKVLGYCRTPNDTETKAKLRRFVWSRTHAC